MSDRPHESSNASKTSNYAVLYEKLQELDRNMTKLQENLQVTAEQVPVFRDLESLHSSMLMATTRIVNEKKKKEQS